MADKQYTSNSAKREVQRRHLFQKTYNIDYLTKKRVKEQR